MQDNATLFGFGGTEAKAEPKRDRVHTRSYGRKVKVVAPADPTRSVSQTLALDAGTRIEKVYARIKAAPLGSASIAEVADVRGSAGSFVIDFGRMRTVTGLTFSGTREGVHAWQGAAFASQKIGGYSTVGNVTKFNEVLTERLRVDADSSVSVSDIEAGTVRLPGAPADVELVVGTQRVWFQSGELKRAAIGTEAGADDYFVASIDVTEAVRTAIAGGETEVPFELRAATAGQLALALDTRIVRMADVQFPEGSERVVTFAEEGTATLTLPLPAESNRWRIAEIWSKVSARLGPERVTPAIGPATTSAAVLVLDADHPVALPISADQLVLFGAIAGARIPLRAIDGDAELAGVVLTDVGGKPGPALDGGALPPITLAKAESSAFTSLLLAKPARLTGGGLWLALSVTRGRVELDLGGAGGGAILRGRAGGPFLAFSSAVAFTPRAALRVIGEPAAGTTLYALAANLPGETTQQLVLPSADGVLLQLQPATPLTTSTRALTINLTATAKGTYRFSNAQVFYRLPEDED